MRIDSINVFNFRGIGRLRLELDPHFTLLVGDNGSGKTSILSALSIALGIWHLSDMLGDAQWRNIMDHELRELPDYVNGERQFRSTGQAQITATGTIGKSPVIEWRRGKLKRGTKTLNEDSVAAQDAIDAVLKARENKEQALPLLASYGAGRAWLPSNKRELADLSGDLKSRQEDGYYDCLNERIRIKDVMKWFLIQASRRDALGRFKPAYEAVRLALQRGIPGADDIYWDANKAELVVSINGAAQPFSYLSDGQRTMASTIADMAIRAVTLNTHLLGDGNGHEHPEKVLDETPGVVLIDEVDVHLHPEWQRSVVGDLLKTFPKVQFVCSSHSAQVMGEVPAIIEGRPLGSVWILGEEGPRRPMVNYADSNWNLEHQMGPEVESRNKRVAELLNIAKTAMIEDELDLAESSLNDARKMMGGEDGELASLEGSLGTLKKLAHADD